MPDRPAKPDPEPTETGKPHPGARAGTERARDEQRAGGGPRYGGGPWEVAEERGERRFGHARNDDADPSELARGQGAPDDDAWPGDDASPRSDASGPEPALAEPAGAARGESESGGQRAGFGRGEKPRKAKARTKPNPRSRKP